MSPIRSRWDCREERAAGTKTHLNDIRRKLNVVSAIEIRMKIRGM
jgi:hypothetical protein